MNCLDTKTRSQIIGCLIEGCSVRATVRMTGAAKNTVVRLLADIGGRALSITTATCAISESAACNVTKSGNSWARRQRTSRLEQEARGMGRRLDVGWNRCRHETGCVVPRRRSGWRMGEWSSCRIALSRIRGRVQITTDGHRAYLEAVENAFGADIDYAKLQKIYGAPMDERAALQSGQVHWLRHESCERQP